MNGEIQNEIFQAMEQTDFYPHSATSVIQHETHISRVFVTGETVYKIKKPLDLGFLDFTDLEKRRHYCEEEVRLNRRLAPDTYTGVVPITFSDGRYSLGEQKEQAVEFAVKMRRLPDNLSMRYLLKTSGVDDEAVDDLAGLLASFYSKAETGDAVNAYGSWETIRENCEDNFRMTETHAGDVFDERMFGIVRAATRAFLQRRKSLLCHRVEQGKIRDCHGDLRTDHVYFTEDGIRIIDCVEFSERFRYQDIACDLAFLAMDLDHEDRPETARRFIEAYAEHSKDRDVFVLLDFYKCYRAMVRCKVNCLRLGEKGIGARERNSLLDDTAKYLDLAYRYAERFTRPTLRIVCGMPASGKSAVSAELSRILEIPAFNSDVVRKDLFGRHSEDADIPFESGIYSTCATSLAYGKLLLMAQEEMEKGNSVILDATFGSRRRRAEAVRLACDMDANIIFAECATSEQTLKFRLAEREKTGSVSDARLSHFEKFKERFEPLDEVGEETHILVDTGKPLEECIRLILSRDYLAPAAYLRKGEKSCFKTY